MSSEGKKRNSLYTVTNPIEESFLTNTRTRNNALVEQHLKRSDVYRPYLFNSRDVYLVEDTTRNFYFCNPRCLPPTLTGGLRGFIFSCHGLP